MTLATNIVTLGLTDASTLTRARPLYSHPRAFHYTMLHNIWIGVLIKRGVSLLEEGTFNDMPR